MLFVRFVTGFPVTDRLEISLITYLLTYLLTYSMEQSPSQKANRFPATQ